MWKYSTLLLLLLARVARRGASPVIQMEPIVNGYPIDISSVPWQVALLQDGSLICGGAIIGEAIIITAADCFSNVSAIGQITVRAGSSFWNYGGQLVKALDFKIHEHYGDDTKENNIAVVRLGRPLNFSGNYTSKISLSTASPENNEEVLVSGWGRIRRNVVNSPNHLHAVYLKIVNRAACSQSLYAYTGFEITKDMICAEAEGKSACGVDRGGPLVNNNQLVGIVSWNLGCPKRGYPGVYTDIAQLCDWIKDTMLEFDEYPDSDPLHNDVSDNNAIEISAGVDHEHETKSSNWEQY